MSFWYYSLDKKPTKLFLDFCPEFFCSFLGASWKLFGLPGDLVFTIINKKAYRKPQKASRKPQGSYINFQGRNPYNIFVAILENQCPHKFILSLTDLSYVFVFYIECGSWNSNLKLFLVPVPGVAQPGKPGRDQAQAMGFFLPEDMNSINLRIFPAIASYVFMWSEKCINHSHSTVNRWLDGREIYRLDGKI